MDELDAFFEKARKVCLSETECAACVKRIRRSMEESPVRDGKEACRTEHMTGVDPSLTMKAQAILLTPEEADRAGKALFAFMKDHPVDMAAALRQHEKQAGFFEKFSLRFSPVLASILVLVLGTGALAYAAEYALPDDALYPVKIHVNETVHAMLAVNAEKRAEWEVVRAVRRAKEATQLAEKSRLTRERSKELIAAFNAHIAKAQSNIQAVAQKGNPDRARRISQKTEVALRKQIDALQQNATIVALRRNVERAAKSITALGSSMNEDIAIYADTDVPRMMAKKSSTDDTASSSSSHALVAVDVTIAEKADAIARNMAKENGAMSTTSMMIHKTSAKIRATQSSSAQSSGTGSSSLQKSSTSSTTMESTSASSAAEIDMFMSSSEGLPVTVDIP